MNFRDNVEQYIEDFSKKAELLAKIGMIVIVGGKKEKITDIDKKNCKISTDHLNYFPASKAKGPNGEKICATKEDMYEAKIEEMASVPSKGGNDLDHRIVRALKAGKTNAEIAALIDKIGAENLDTSISVERKTSAKLATMFRQSFKGANDVEAKKEYKSKPKSYEEKLRDSEKKIEKKLQVPFFERGRNKKKTASFIDN